MGKPFSTQRQLNCRAVVNVALDLNCRDEIIPVLAALQYITLKWTPGTGPGDKRELLEEIKVSG